VDFKYAIVLTGGIATGKSTVAKILSSFDFTIIDADKISHEVLDIHYKKIEQLFGKKVIKNQKVDRKTLGAIVFSDEQKRKELESLLHPLIFEEIKRLSCIEDKKEKPYFIDIPLFFETKNYPIKKSLVVYAPKAYQLKRLMQRDGYNKQEALSRIESQMDIEEKVKLATYMIDNTENIETLTSKCFRIKEKILKDF